MNAPKRIQRKRAKGWRMPEGAVYVGRPSKWGNPFGESAFPFEAIQDGIAWGPQWRRHAVEMFALHTGPMGNCEYDDETLAELHRDLAGKDLVCWCPLDQPCHADVLLDIANGGGS